MTSNDFISVQRATQTKNNTADGLFCLLCSQLKM